MAQTVTRFRLTLTSDAPLQTVTDYQALFLNNTPMMDVRAPIEFERGAFPNSTNLPLINNDERQAVGTRYKEQGQDAAIELGHDFVKDDIKEQRVAAWQTFFESHPNGVLYCFRGGLRSRLTQQALADAGINMPLVKGGYKAMRSYLLNALHDSVKQHPIQILSGPTGSGKTDVIHQWHHSVDLEGLANHRGSAFGRTGQAQPSQIDFENAWSIQWMKRQQISPAPVLFEDESRLIGRISVLPEFLALSKRSDVITLEAPLEERIERIRNDYCIELYQRTLPDGEAKAIAQLDDFIRSALNRIQKRLGGDRYAALLQTLEKAMSDFKNQNSWHGFDLIIERLLVDYYDPMYAYQFQAKAKQQIFKGTHGEILQWLSQQNPR